MICTSSISPWRSAAVAEPDGDDLGDVGDRGVLSAAEHRRKLRFRLRARGEDVGRDRVQRMVCDCGRRVAHLGIGILAHVLAAELRCPEAVCVLPPSHPFAVGGACDRADGTQLGVLSGSGCPPLRSRLRRQTPRVRTLPIPRHSLPRCWRPPRRCRHSWKPSRPQGCVHLRLGIRGYSRPRVSSPPLPHFGPTCHFSLPSPSLRSPRLRPLTLCGALDPVGRAGCSVRGLRRRLLRRPHGERGPGR